MNLSKLMVIENKVPRTCIYCGAPVMIEDDGSGTPSVRCVNQRCFKKVADEALYWLKSIGYKDYWTEELLFRLAETGVIRSLTDLYKISLFQIADSLMEKTTSVLSNRLYMSLQASVGNISIAQFLVGLCIPYCGERICLKASEKISSVEDIVKVMGSREMSRVLGTKQRVVVGWLSNKSSLIEELFVKVKPRLNSVETRKVAKLVGLNICISGILNSPRERFVDTIKQNGGNFQLRLIRKTKYLLVGRDPEAKVLEKAKKYRTKILTENEFWELLE